MIYDLKDDILIRNMTDSDAIIITEEENAQGWSASIDKYEIRLKDQREGRAIALVAEYCGNVAGYIHVYPDSVRGAFEAHSGCM